MKTGVMKYLVLLVAFSAVKEIRGCFSNSQQQSISIKTGSSFYHECHCADPSTPVEELKWLDPHDQEVGVLGLGTEPLVYIERQGRTISLQIPRISKTTSGPYKCLATVSGKVYTSVFVIEAYDPLYFVATNRSQHIIKGKDSLVHCNARGESAPFITWYKELEEPIRLLNNEKYQIEPNGLIIKNVDDDDNGTYKCRATVFETGEDVDRYIELEVLRLPVIIEMDVKPNKTVIIGDSLSIECIATGVPHPQYRWNKTTDVVTTENWQTEMNKISFAKIEPSDRGTYQCKAFNRAGATSKEVFIEVLEPAIIESIENVTAAEGSTTQIICKAYGRPAPILTMDFEKDGADRDPSIIWDRRKINDTLSMFILTFTSVKRSHEGIYTCHAENEVDSASETAELKVLYKPYFEEERETVWAWNGRTVNLSCAHDSSPPSNISWRFLGTNIPTIEQVAMNRLLIPEDKQDAEYLTIDAVGGKSIYGEYECEATNEQGQANKTILLQEGFAPSTISDLKIAELTASSVTFEIKAPVNAIPIPPIIGFTAEYDEERNYEITTIHKNRTWSIDRPYQVDRLKANTSYLIKFAAINEVGTGEWGGYLPFSTLERTIPEPPIWEDAKVKIAEENDLIVRWKEADDDDVVDYYVIKYCPVYNEKVMHHLCKEDVVNSVTSVSLVHLHLNTTYLLELVAHNSKGNSSTAELYVTTPAIKEELPETVSASAMIAVSIVVVVLCILSLDAVLFCWRRQGLIATCYYRKNKKAKEDDTLSRDKKGLLRDSSNPSTMDDASKRDRGHKEFEYNKTTGVITGKHSSV